MHLSYVARIVCLLLIGWAVLQTLGDVLAWTIAPWLERLSAPNARTKERRLFWLLLAARAFPLLLATCFLLPSYVLGEDNHAPEEVGWLTMLAAALVALWWMANLVRQGMAIERTRRSVAKCPTVGQTQTGLPILLYPGKKPLLALTGIFAPRILLSRKLMEPAWCSPEALNVALEHEIAHARHHDNLKLLLISLPHLRIATKACPSLEQRWRLAAELASDEESVCGQPQRSILLAEMLVRMARGYQEDQPQASIAFLSRAEDLRVRVDRLLQMSQPVFEGTSHERAARNTWAISAVMASAALLAYLCIGFGHAFAELIFQLN